MSCILFLNWKQELVISKTQNNQALKRVEELETVQKEVQNGLQVLPFLCCSSLTWLLKAEKERRLRSERDVEKIREEFKASSELLAMQNHAIAVEAMQLRSQVF